MQPLHIRTKSQSAVIEDPEILAAIQSLGSSSPSQLQSSHKSVASGLLRLPLGTIAPPDDEDVDAPKKKPWYHLRRKRYASEGSGTVSNPPAGSPTLPVDEEMGGIGTGPQPVRSFVVIRKPQSSAHLGQPGPSTLRYANATD